MENQINFDFGMVGLGVMGRNLLLNMADHGYTVIGLDLDATKVAALEQEAAEGKKVHGTVSAEEFIRSLRKPRALMLLVPAGKAVDSVINTLLPFLEPGDIVIDGGNSYFTDTDRRMAFLAEKGINYLGVGISGGEKGARFGPSMMPGGSETAYQRVKPIFESVAAKVNGEPCVTYLGAGSAGNYVKMVHNGIEYAIMQLLSETYDLFKHGIQATDDELHQIYDEWNRTELQSFLVEITADIFLKNDEKTGKRLVNLILDQAKSKGTGKWTSQNAMDLQVPLPTVDMAVAMRDMSAHKPEREKAATILSAQPLPAVTIGDRVAFIKQVKNAFYVSMLTCYAQGLALLRVASQSYNYGLKLNDVARIWRGGCIIRAACLEDIRQAFEKQPDLANLLIDAKIASEVLKRQADTRSVVKTAVDLGVAVPALMASLSYFDAYRSKNLPTNLIQAQRDYFGAHTYERIDQEGVFHTDWS
jgi:6-phosphogluconate dehydrogenase